MPNFEAQLGVGFEGHPLIGASDDNAYLAKSDPDKETFEDVFGAAVLAALNAWFAAEGVPTHMNDWHSYLIPLASPSGSQSESDVVTHINWRLNPSGSANPEFKVGDPDVAATFRGVRYFYFEGRRVCLHSHLLLRDTGGGLAEWREPAESGYDDQQAVEITLAWERFS